LFTILFNLCLVAAVYCVYTCSDLSLAAVLFIIVGFWCVIAHFGLDFHRFGAMSHTFGMCTHWIGALSHTFGACTHTL